MANEMTGFNFQPGQDDEMRRVMNRGANASGNNMANQALRVLSLRLPNVLGGRPLTPRSLTGPTMGGPGPNNGNPTLGVTGPNAGSGLGALVSGAVGGNASGGSGAPNITPGIGSTTPPGIIEGPGSGYTYGPTPGSPSNWTPTGPMTGGITGGNGGELANGGELPVMGGGIDFLSGLLRLFGQQRG